MGKEYAVELAALATTYKAAKSVNTDKLKKFTDKWDNAPVYAAGHGGSLVLAEFASMLHSNCHAVTPYELQQTNIPIKANILLASAGGSNYDILSIARKLKSRNIMGICAKYNTKLSNIIDCFGIDLACGRDGFLATNSLLAGITWLARAMGKRLPDKLPISHDVDLKLPNREFILLHDLQGKPAARDIETRCIEAGLCNVQTADYRNFGHGRYTWLNIRPKTEIVCLIGPNCVDVANETLRLIPETTSVRKIQTDCVGAAGSLELLIHTIRLAGEIGKSQNIDPGNIKNQTCRKLYKMDIDSIQPRA